MDEARRVAGERNGGNEMTERLDEVRLAELEQCIESVTSGPWGRDCRYIHSDEILALIAEVRALRAEAMLSKRYSEALAWYADEAHYAVDAYIDYGDRARRALVVSDEY